VSEHLGHSSIHMTEIYVPPVKRERQEASDALGEAFNNVPIWRKNWRKSSKRKTECIETPLEISTAG